MCRLLWQCLVISLFFMFLHNDICSSSSPSKPALCSPDQSYALLHFKNSFSISNFIYSTHDRTMKIFCTNGGVPYPKTEYWKEGSDCCSWDGVTCDRLTGHVIGLDVSCSSLVGTLYPNNTLFHLHHLRKLNLSHNDFSSSEVSSMFGHFTKLTHLDLSFSNFSGSVPLEISYLSNLVSFDFSDNPMIQLDQHSFDRFSQNLTNLRVLALEYTDMSSIAPSSLVNLTSSLISLHLRRSQLQGKFPNDVLRFPFLEELDLSENGSFIGHLPKFNWSSPLRLLDFSFSNFYGDVMDDPTYLPDAIGDLVYLNVLNLAFCGFKGSVPEALFNLTRLTSLDLGNNSFSGRIAASISNLDKLTNLYLYSNEFSGQLPPSIFNLTQLSYMYLSANQLEGHFPSQVRGLPHLVRLDLSNNLLSGRIRSWLLALPSLQHLVLTNNKLTGPIDPFEQPGPVQDVNLANNKIHGSIPDSMFELVNLVELDLSSNNLSGIVNIDLFSKLINLESVDFSYNRDLSLKSHNISNFSLSNLTSFQFSSCNLTEFPISLRNFKNLTTLDLSDNKITGQISQEELGLWQDLGYLNVSHNFLTRVVQMPLQKLYFLDLHSNLLQGPFAVPVHAASMIFFSVSHNNLTGEIPSMICNMSSLEYLVLANNSFSGMIPECLRNYEVLKVLDLSMNNFHGTIPQIFPYGSSLKTINLNGNQLEGPLPISLVNCSSLKVLDVGNNMVNGTFPLWLATLPELEVLILRSNRFLGCIGNSKTRFPFAKLQILDIAHNQFTGILPMKLFESFKTMMYGHRNNTSVDYTRSSHYQNRMALFWKGKYGQFARILIVLTTIDLSNNQFQRKIPEVFGKLNNLMFFSISHNNLTGEIPSTICNMSSLKYLVLANNSFTGMILECLRNYKFLEVLDLSMNNLHGSIPQIFPNGSSLKTINLNGNKLDGPLPTSLANCSSLEVLDVGNNMVNGMFPLWLATLPKLQVLILRSNRFLSCIGNFETRSPFAKLQILDITHNQFIRILPTKLFKSFKTMMHGHDKHTSIDHMGSMYYQNSVVLTWKGRDVRFERILTILTTIDLSSNQFQGKIPEVIGELKSLIVFNLSHNRLTGQIPSSLRNLMELESLDLSSNKLAKEIPMQLTSLTFLSVLNVSYNQLVGPIPRGNQFSTFENNSYIGNLGLYGPPLSKICVGDEAPEPTPPNEEEDNWS